MARKQNGELRIWKVDNMARFVKWQVDKIASRQSDKLAKWQVDDIT
jgi:hypothetical protein